MLSSSSVVECRRSLPSLGAPIAATSRDDNGGKFPNKLLEVPNGEIGRVESILNGLDDVPNKLVVKGVAEGVAEGIAAPNNGCVVLGLRDHLGADEEAAAESDQLLLLLGNREGPEGNSWLRVCWSPNNWSPEPILASWLRVRCESVAGG